ncbi:hypothetical protein MJO28_002578 [Puccinia striiformis f. sp. tritici]|uniref:Uncharacterized protein n=1 Tax=Puccinia striiformis f. sp. tritici TaxID=168172 RepID=A0ACC0EQR2_9BASI|nr:hypothetical protein MJO28_002578 [Puccinia striiformis f. sp. tritici]
MITNTSKIIYLLALFDYHQSSRLFSRTWAYFKASTLQDIGSVVWLLIEESPCLNSSACNISQGSLNDQDPFIPSMLVAFGRFDWDWNIQETHTDK